MKKKRLRPLFKLGGDVQPANKVDGAPGGNNGELQHMKYVGTQNI